MDIEGETGLDVR